MTAKSRSAEISLPAEAAALSGKRILIVDDWFMVAQELARMARHAGWDVVGPVGDLARALKAATEERLDGAILDVNINGRDVFPVADELLCRDVPFIFVTGYDAHGTLPAEFRGFPALEKPFQQDQLIELMWRTFATPKA